MENIKEKKCSGRIVWVWSVRSHSILLANNEDQKKSWILGPAWSVFQRENWVIMSIMRNCCWISKQVIKKRAVVALKSTHCKVTSKTFVRNFDIDICMFLNVHLNCLSLSFSEFPGRHYGKNIDLPSIFRQVSILMKRWVKCVKLVDTMKTMDILIESVTVGYLGRCFLKIFATTKLFFLDILLILNSFEM